MVGLIICEEEIINAFKHFVSKQGEGVILYSDDGSVIKLQDVVGLIEEQKAEIERFNDMGFTLEYCNLYEENEWLTEILRQYMNGELINEDVFCQQVKDIQEVRKHTAKEILQELLLVESVEQWQENEQLVQFGNKIVDKILELAKRFGIEVE